jgi:hypothetical protein
METLKLPIKFVNGNSFDIDENFLANTSVEVVSGEVALA